MRIVLIASRTIPVPPANYGGTELVIYFLAEELVRRGHHVTVFAAKGSKTSARLYEYPSGNKRKMLHFIIRHMPRKVDIIHDHEGLIAKINPPVPTLRQTHGSVMIRRAQIPVYVSQTMLATIGRKKGYYLHNGIRLQDYEFREQKDDYLLFLGRISAMKGVHHAIEVARLTGRRLIIAGPSQESAEEKQYYLSQVAPHLHSGITYIGSVGGQKKRELLSQAYCVLFPSECNEAFGLVPIESLASGTPVLALPNGAVPEVLSGLPGLVCNDSKEMARKVTSGTFPTPQECRSYIEQRFTDKQMTDKALELYKQIRKGKQYKMMKGSEWSLLMNKLRK